MENYVNRMNKQEQGVKDLIFNSVFQPRIVKIKDNFGNILREKYPDEFPPERFEEDNVFFNIYAGKYKYIIHDHSDSNMFVILEDNNYILDIDCFEDV